MSLHEPQARRAMALSIGDGVAWAVMVGLGEMWFVADAVRLSASTTALALVVSLPLCLGALGPLITLRFLAGSRSGRPVSRRRWVAGCAAAQAALLGLQAWSDWSGWSTPASLIAVAALYQGLAQAAGAAWSSWFGDVVPAAWRGRFFGRRNRLVYGATLLTVLGGGEFLERVQGAPLAPGSGGGGEAALGFAALFGVAALARAVSAGLLLVTPEPSFSGVSRPRRALGFLRTARGGGALRLLGLGASLQFAVYLASPFFGPYMLEELAFDYREYTIGTLTVVLMKALSMPGWGRAVDQFGARSVYALAVLGIALVPIPWLFAEGLWLAVFAQGLSGFSWAGHELGTLSVLLESSYRGTRMHVLAAQGLFQGTAQFLGSLAGAGLAALGGDLRWAFAVSCGARLAVALGVPRLLPDPTGQPVGRAQLALRVIGFRPSGALVHRPVLRGDGPRRQDGARAPAGASPEPPAGFPPAAADPDPDR